MTWLCPVCRKDLPDSHTWCPDHGKRGIENLAGRMVFGRYEIKDLVDVGGMGSSVWRAWQISTERVVAVKVLPRATDEAAQRFERGARIASKLNHPNIITVHDYGVTQDGKLMLVLELLVGSTLQAVLRSGKELPGPRALAVTEQILRALEHAHANSVVHRDLKPGNLFLTQAHDDRDHVKVLDFGIAKYIEEDATDRGDDAEALEVTAAGEVCGTPYYMAPEQIAGERVDARVDLYALGVVLFRMLTARLPFTGKSHQDLYRKHMLEEVPSFAEVRPDLSFPAGVEDITRTALAKRVDERFQSAREMRQAISALVGGDSTVPDIHLPFDDETKVEVAPISFSALDWQTGPPSETTRSGIRRLTRARSHKGLFLAAAILLALAGGVIAMLTRSPDPGAEPARGQVVVSPLDGEGTAGVPAKPSPGAAAAAKASREPKPAVKKVIFQKVKIDTVPSGATVFLLGQPLGATPLVAELPEGTHTLSLRRDKYKPASIDVTVPDPEGRDRIEKHVTLSPVPPPAPPPVVKEPAPAKPKPAAAAATTKKKASRPARSRRKAVRRPAPRTRPPKTKTPKVRLLDEEEEEPPPPKTPKKVKLLGD